MLTINKEQAELLAKHGIKYGIGHVWHPEVRDGEPVAVIDKHYFDDKPGKDPLDIHLGRLRPFCGDEYAYTLKGKRMKVENGLPHEDVQPVPDWTIEEDGTLVNKEKGYAIGPDQLLEQKDWILHMMCKPWVNLNSFIPAYFLALKRLGIRNAEILTSYE